MGTTQEPAPDTAPDDEGGEPVCWLSRVCRDCGRLAEDENQVICQACGAALED